MRHIAIIGSGPAGYYTAEACQKSSAMTVRVDIIDRLPVPFGLIRTGVAPDHQSIKGVSRRYEAVALTDNVRFVGNVHGRPGRLASPSCAALYDAVVLATGAPADRPLGMPGDDLPGVVGSAAFVGWYNGHPDFAGLAPAARRAGRGGDRQRQCRARRRPHPRQDREPSSPARTSSAMRSPHLGAPRHRPTITILGRRGPHQIAMTPKELGELGHLARAAPRVDPADLPPLEADAALDPGQRKSVAHLRDFARSARRDKPIAIVFDFFAMPLRDRGRRQGRARDRRADRGSMPTGRASAPARPMPIPAGLVVSCIGYRTPPIEGVPYDERAGRFANDEGRIAPGLYAVGWARRGPTGTIGTNRPDGFLIAEQIAADLPGDSGKAGRAGLDALLASARRRRRHLPRLAEDRQRPKSPARARAPRARSSSSIETMLGARDES